MTKLECSVKNCVYNEEPYCCKGDIMVEGRDAKTQVKQHVQVFRREQKTAVLTLLVTRARILMSIVRQ